MLSGVPQSFDGCSVLLHLANVCSAWHSIFLAMCCVFWDSALNILLLHDICLSAEAVYQTEYGPHTKSVYGGGWLKAIIICPWMYQGNDGSVKASWGKAAHWIGSDTQKHLLESCFWSLMCRETDVAETGRGTKMQQNFTSNRHKGLTLTLFPCSFARLLVVYMYASV